VTADFAGEDLQLFEIANAPGETYGMTVAGKGASDGAAEPIAGADDQANTLGVDNFIHGLELMGWVI
jgi:hypothetical protein